MWTHRHTERDTDWLVWTADNGDTFNYQLLGTGPDARLLLCAVTPERKDEIND